MARIFYGRVTGEIYGCHPTAFLRGDEPLETDGGGAVVPLPAGIAWIDVPESPDQIPWPVPAAWIPPGKTLAAGEQFCRVDPVAGRIEMRPDATPPPPVAVQTASWDADPRGRALLRYLAAREGRSVAQVRADLGAFTQD